MYMSVKKKKKKKENTATSIHQDVDRIRRDFSICVVSGRKPEDYQRYRLRSILTLAEV